MEEPPKIVRKAPPVLPHVARALQYGGPPASVGPSGQVENSQRLLPNLSVFAGEVVSQNRFQKEALEGLQQILKQLHSDVETQKKMYQSLSTERLLWEQKIVLCKETAIHSRSEISEVKSELLDLMKIKQKILDQIQTTEIDISKCENQIKNQVCKMEKHIQKIVKIEEKGEVFRKISEAREKLSRVQDNINQYVTSKNMALESAEIRSEMKKLDEEKMKLSGILVHKRNQVKGEEEKISKKLQEQDVARNKFAAQKLRLRRQIEKSKNVRQQLRDEADSIRMQIREIADHFLQKC
uniref:uncharacterized protein LOC120341277 n=1 Tax=Styela clava TaxID=7725 RepID=UPI00193A0B09|nr:uncharacterized protein LOC120341277 [Styela clava]